MLSQIRWLKVFSLSAYGSQALTRVLRLTVALAARHVSVSFNSLWRLRDLRNPFLVGPRRCAERIISRTFSMALDA